MSNTPNSQQQRKKNNALLFHQVNEGKSGPKCTNCAGPHEATNPDCMARPSRKYVQVTPRTPAELRIIRQWGQRDFKAALIKSEAKDKASEFANLSTDIVKAPEKVMEDNE